MNAEALTTIASVIALAALYVFLPLTYAVYARHRGQTPLPCPETGETASVQIDAGRAARTSLFGHPSLRVADCTLWPGQVGCAQGCLKGIRG